MMMMIMVMIMMMMTMMVVVVMMIGLRMTVPVAIWWRAEGSKKTRLSDLTVKHLQLHHSVPNFTIHFSWTVTYKKGPPYRKSDCKRSKHKSCKS